MKKTSLSENVAILHRAAAGGGGDVAYSAAAAERAALAITRSKAFAKLGTARRMGEQL